ncbi:MAG: HU family DNA-binding protein [Candidatus Aminicenantes bacterium]|nr:HU family DNA-binding protein [Candidatus Aminicenantes bacterium]
MIKKDIVQKIEENGGFSRGDSLVIVDSILNHIKESLKKGEKIEIRGFASLKVVPKKTGYGRDIRRNKQIRIQGGKRIKFKPGQELKDIT